MESLTVVIPTYNEAANIGPLLRELHERFVGCPVEFLVVDDGSKDATAALARQAGARVVVRRGERGLATAVVRGIQEARGRLVAVMDADFQHPTKAVKELYDTAVGTGADLVVGSRYAKGGSIGSFGLVRRTVSRGAATMARLALPPVREARLTDPMSGLFLVRKERVAIARLAPKGYKILLEIIAKSDLRRIEEVGYTFADRRGGASKLGSTVLWHYLVHLAVLAVQHPENRRILRFGLVGLSGVAVNLGVLLGLAHLGVETHLATIFAIETSVVTNFLLNDAWTFRDRRDLPWPARLGLFHGVSAVSFVVNFLVTSLLHDFAGTPLALASLVGVAAGFVPNYLGNHRLTYGARKRPHWRAWLPVTALAVVAAGMYLPVLDQPSFIYFDESYYVTVAYQFEAGTFEDPCWGADARRPLNNEHPPLAKLILWASIHAYDTAHPIFDGCRAPDDTTPLSEPCHVRDDGRIVATADTRKACFDAYTEYARMHSNPYAWRAPAAVFGIATVAGIAQGSRRLFASTTAGVLAGALVLADPMVLSASRIAILDIFAAGFAALAFWSATHPTRRGVLLSALCLGLGFACKYNVLFLGPPVLMVALWTHHRAGRLRGTRVLLAALGYPVIALSVLLATYTPWWVMWIRDEGWTWAIQHWLELQEAGLRWLGAGQQDHVYSSQPLEWIALTKPMLWLGPVPSAAADGWPDSYIYSLGNWVLWWGSLLVVGWALARLVWRLVALQAVSWTWPSTAWMALPRYVQALAVSALLPTFAFVGFLLLQRTSYIFYMVGVAPFMAVPAAGFVAHALAKGGRSRAVAMGLATLAFVVFLLYAPVALGIPIPRPYFEVVMRILPWMSHCGSRADWSGIVAHCPNV